MFTAYMLTSRPGSFENANIVHFFENLFRFKFYLIVEKLAKCYNSHFGTNNVFLTEDRLVKNVKKKVLKKKILFIVKGVCILGALDNGPGGHQLYEASSCEEHNMEVTRAHQDILPSPFCEKQNLEVACRKFKSRRFTNYFWFKAAFVQFQI